MSHSLPIVSAIRLPFPTMANFSVCYWIYILSLLASSVHSLQTADRMAENIINTRVIPWIKFIFHRQKIWVYYDCSQNIAFLNLNLLSLLFAFLLLEWESPRNQLHCFFLNVLFMNFYTLYFFPHRTLWFISFLSLFLTLSQKQNKNENQNK